MRWMIIESHNRAPRNFIVFVPINLVKKWRKKTKGKFSVGKQQSSTKNCMHSTAYKARYRNTLYQNSKNLLYRSSIELFSSFIHSHFPMSSSYAVVTCPLFLFNLSMSIVDISDWLSSFNALCSIWFSIDGGWKEVYRYTFSLLIIIIKHMLNENKVTKS